jgi:predicted DNA repair protein MutK
MASIRARLLRVEPIRGEARCRPARAASWSGRHPATAPVASAAMWILQPRDESERTLARLALLAAVAGAVRLEELGEHLRREEHRAWWAGHGRDVINGAAVLVLSAGLVLLGFPAPAAFVGGGLMTLALTGVSALEARIPERLHPRALAIALGLALMLPVLLWSAEVVDGLDDLATALFGD